MTDIRTATVPASELIRAITNAMLFASKDDTLPALTSVHFRPGLEPGQLLLEATNRYVASQESVDLADLDHSTGHEDHEGACPVPATELDVLVSTRDAAKLVKTLKLIINPDAERFVPAERPHVTIEHAEDGKKVAFKLTQNLDQDAELSFALAYGEFPRIDSLMKEPEMEPEKLDARLQAEADQAKAAGRTPRPKADVWERRYLFNRDWLALFPKVDTGQKHDMIDFRFTASAKPAIVHIGERFRALIVPVKPAV